MWKVSSAISGYDDNPVTQRLRHQRFDLKFGGINLLALDEYLMPEMEAQQLPEQYLKPPVLGGGRSSMHYVLNGLAVEIFRQNI